MNTATTGAMVVNGTLSIGGAGRGVRRRTDVLFRRLQRRRRPAQRHDAGHVLLTGASWVAAATFEDDGDSVAGTAGGSATLAFTPIDGSTYTLETSIQNIVGDTDWFALGFASGQSTANSSNARFITGNRRRPGLGDVPRCSVRFDKSRRSSEIRALNRTAASPAAHLGLSDANPAGGNVDLRITLDTTGGAGNWTATMEADTGSGFQVIRATEITARRGDQFGRHCQLEHRRSHGYDQFVLADRR